MIRLLVLVLAGLYCFPWLRIPDVGGVALPIQRLLSWIGLILLALYLALYGRLRTGPIAKAFVATVAGFLVFLLLTLLEKLAFGENFYVLYFAMAFSKYMAIFTVAFLVYYALAVGLVAYGRFVRLVIGSGIVATLITFGLLALYYAGFRSQNEILAQSFGGALGVWPTGGFLPRLAGTTVEPQQLSVAVLTPLLLTLSRKMHRKRWAAAAAIFLVILLSQSKFAVISIAFVGLYLFLVYSEHRALILTGAVVAVPVLALAMIRLPTYALTLSQGLKSGAFVQRFGEILILIDIIRHHTFLGIGAGQYGIYRGVLFYGNPMFAPGWTPNMDFLQVFAETGIIGFIITVATIGALVIFFVRSYPRVVEDDRETYLAFLLGAIAIILNMFIGYELLHVFFWINVGVLLYLAERAYWSTHSQHGPRG